MRGSESKNQLSGTRSQIAILVLVADLLRYDFTDPQCLPSREP